jgi:hypothetical protein
MLTPRESTFSRRRRQSNVLRNGRNGSRLRPLVQLEVRKAISAMAETKYLEITTFNGTISTTPSIFNISEVPQGTTDLTRIGDSLSAISMYYNFLFNVSATDPYNAVRCIVFQYHAAVAGGTTPPAAEILTDPTAVGNLTSGYNQDSLDADLITIISDTLHLTSAALPLAHLEKTSTNFRKDIQFTGASLGGYHKLFLMVVSDSAAATHPGYIGTTRLLFHDM